MSRLLEVILFLLLVWLLMSGCNGYRPPIVDIRDEPTPIDWSPRQPEKFAEAIQKFRGYDSSFKFQNMLQKQQEKMQ